MPVRATETRSGGEKGGTTETLLQAELRDLRSLVVHADHLRWVTRGPAAEDFDALVYRFSEDWRRWTESIASCVIDLGIPPDGRVSSLTEGSYRAWLPDDWVETTEADRWMLGELGVPAEWAHVRKAEAEALEVVQLFDDIATGVARERTEFENWSDARRQTADRPDEASQQKDQGMNLDWSG
jgi:starvation-inducible DNA-binding protein